MHDSDIRGPMRVMTYLYNPIIIDNYQIRISVIMNEEKFLRNNNLKEKNISNTIK